jgi:hypothetical protein
VFGAPIGAVVRLIQRIIEGPRVRPGPANDIRLVLAVMGAMLGLAILVRVVWEVWRLAGR